MIDDTPSIAKLQLENDQLTRQLNHARQGLDVCASIISDTRRDGVLGMGRLMGRMRRVDRAVRQAIDMIDNDIPF